MSAHLVQVAPSNAVTRRCWREIFPLQASRPIHVDDVSTSPPPSSACLLAFRSSPHRLPATECFIARARSPSPVLQLSSRCCEALPLSARHPRCSSEVHGGSWCSTPYAAHKILPAGTRSPPSQHRHLKRLRKRTFAVTNPCRTMSLPSWAHCLGHSSSTFGVTADFYARYWRGLGPPGLRCALHMCDGWAAERRESPDSYNGCA